MPIDYSKTKIYKIYSFLGDKIYIGATTNDLLSHRMTKHRRNYKEWKEGKRRLMTSFILFDEYGIENCLIELIDAKECLNKNESDRLEGFYIKSIVCVNKIVAGRTNIEYKQDNKEKIKEQRKIYEEKNKDKIANKKKEYYQQNKEKK